MKTNNKVVMMIVGIPIITTMLSATILSSTYVSADNDSVVDQVNITVPVSCTMTGTGMNTHNAEIANGTYTPNIGTTTLHAFCNDNEGFAIYAAGYTGNEIGGTNSNKLVGTNASSNATIASGIATTASNPDLSNWAMKLAISQDSGDTTGTNAFTIDSAPNVDLPSLAEQSATPASFSEYHVVPNEYVKVAHKNSMTDMTATTGGVKLTTTYAAYISKTQPADTYTGQVIYTLVHPAEASKPVPQKSLDTATTMQDVTYCSDRLPEGQVYTLTDSRDGNIYHAARLADGNCWMLDNLALNPTDAATAQNMNEDNTNATTEAIANYLNGGSVKTGWSNWEVSDVTYLDSDFVPMYFNRPYINSQSKDVLVTSYGLASVDGQAKVGIYYNYCAATVGTYCYDIDYSGPFETNPEAFQDVCPANWRMPIDEYDALSQEYGSDAARVDSLQYNLSTPLSGEFYYWSGTDEQNSTGYWWSSSSPVSSVSPGPGVMKVTSETVEIPSFGGRSRVYNVRCLVAK